jgi:uncharacterized tellurite resistance protein B-like protein
MGTVYQNLANEVRAWLLQALGSSLTPDTRALAPELQLAGAVLCLAIVRADHECRQDEHRAMQRALGRLLRLSEDDSVRLLRRAEEELTAPRPLHDFVALINRAVAREQKCRILESLWAIAFADAELAGHEEYLVRKVADWLHLTTADLVETKLRAREAFPYS